MDDQGMGPCVVLCFPPSGFSFLVFPLVKLSIAGLGGARKGGSRVLILDQVVMARVGASGLGVLLLSIAERILEYCSRNPLRCWTSMYHHFDRILEGKDHRRCLLQISIPTRMGDLVHIHRPHGILRSNRISGFIAFEMEETFMEGDGSSHRSSWYQTYSLILFDPSSSNPFLYPMMRHLFDQVLETDPCTLDSHSATFPVRGKWKNLNLDVFLIAPSARMLSTILK
ncbi:hypothetical protein Tco_1235298 [Tanacetum coccineum]